MVRVQVLYFARAREATGGMTEESFEVEGAAADTDALRAALVAKHRAVVCTETDHDAAVSLNEACRAAGAAFIRGDVRGVFGRLFCDFGEAFDVLDVDGEEPHSCIVASVSSQVHAIDERAATGRA